MKVNGHKLGLEMQRNLIHMEIFFTLFFPNLGMRTIKFWKDSFRQPNFSWIMMIGIHSTKMRRITHIRNIRIKGTVVLTLGQGLLGDESPQIRPLWKRCIAVDLGPPLFLA